MIEIFNGIWSVKDLRDNPKKMFVFGDNDLRTGLGGQAIIRCEFNSIGLRTKKRPSYSENSFYNDNELDSNIEKILEDIKFIKEEILFGKTIVFSSGGYGTQRARLKEKAPLTYDFLFKTLLREFGFHNELGKIIPTEDEVKSAIEVPMNYEHNKLGYGQMSPGFFRKELLDSLIFTTFDAIKSGFRTATSRNNLFKKGQLVLFTNSKSTEKLLCRVLKDSYPVRDVSISYWSKLEGWRENYFDLNPDVIDKFQFEFEFICSI